MTTSNESPPPGRGRVYCTKGHEAGGHDAACSPPANPADPELRLLRAIFGLCPDCDRTEPHEHESEEGFSYGPGQ